MNSSTKLIGLSVLSLMFAFSGCGDGKSESGGGSGTSARAASKPLVRKDAQFVIGVNLDKEQAFKIVDAYKQLVFNVAKLEREDIEKAEEKIATYKQDLFADIPPDGRKFIDKSGLRDADVRWAVLSMDSLKVVDGVPQMDGFSCAIGGKADLKKLISAIQEEPDVEISFEEMTLEGEKVWRVAPQKEKGIKEMNKAHVDPHVTSLDGGLVLVAMSRDALAKQIRLYRKGEGKGDSLGRFSAADGELMLFHISNIGDLLRRNISRRDLQMINQVIPDGDELVCGLRSLDIETAVRPDGMMSDAIRLETASEKDADKLRTLAKTGLMTASAQMAREPNVPENLKKVFENVKIGGTDGRVDIQCGSIGLPGIMAGALFPAISSAMLNAQTTAMAMNGRKLHQAITLANTSRETAGKGTVWPRTVKEEGGDDLSGRAFNSATEYFNVLFDMAHYGTSEWSPHLEVLDVGVLGKKAAVGKAITATGLEWCIAANVTEEMPDSTPVLISANFNPALLRHKWDGVSGGSVTLPIGPASGAAKSLFGDKAIVVVRKGGMVDTIKKKYLTYDVLYRRQSFDLTNTNPPLVYLTPTGVAVPGQAGKEK